MEVALFEARLDTRLVARRDDASDRPFVRPRFPASPETRNVNREDLVRPLAPLRPLCTPLGEPGVEAIHVPGEGEQPAIQRRLLRGEQRRELERCPRKLEVRS